jgi:hypothetical protein
VRCAAGTKHNAANVASALWGGKIVLLFLLPFEVTGLILAGMLVFMKPDSEANALTNFDESNMQVRRGGGAVGGVFLGGGAWCSSSSASLPRRWQGSITPPPQHNDQPPARSSANPPPPGILLRRSGR